MKNKLTILMTLFVTISFMSCTKKSVEPPVASPPVLGNVSDPLGPNMEDKGIGPVSELKIESQINHDLAKKGKTVFESKCTSCHKIGERYVGPALSGITKRRRPEWIMNMALNPSEMTQKDPIAKELLAAYIAQMANQNLTQEDARAVLEYFRENDLGK